MTKRRRTGEDIASIARTTKKSSVSPIPAPQSRNPLHANVEVSTATVRNLSVRRVQTTDFVANT